MVYVLGVNLPDRQVVKFALTQFYGIGHATAERICARFQMHRTCRVRDLTPLQVTALASFLSSPKDSISPARYPTATPDFVPIPRRAHTARNREQAAGPDRLKELKLEAELKTEIRDNIAHQKMIGSYVGRRHAMSLPVRGQNTQNNAKTARKLNRVERYR
ncbi:mitochondrial 30S ribosomal protein S13 [Mycena maculata]|uniref:Small ribosomal subunit protein uS13m n=1 Tax=Mycena maculata TaxID=230809 RepID=A0AAD7HNZ0_9AGAR|nr:mitochondrial 30S ribosomal protein S13 [Mycena maculata]